MLSGLISNLMVIRGSISVNYMTPPWPAHIMYAGTHMPGPCSTVEPREIPSWMNIIYYHRADDKRVGFDRTSREVML